MSKIQKTIAPLNVPFIIKVPDAEGEHEYDLVFIPPTGITRRQAVNEINKAIRKAKREMPLEYIFDDLMAILRPKGFICPLTVKSIAW